MTVLVGYLPTPKGDAAFSAALDEATRRNELHVVLNSPRDGALVSADVATPDQVSALAAKADAAGVTIDIQQTPHSGEFADLLLNRRPGSPRRSSSSGYPGVPASASSSSAATPSRFSSKPTDRCWQ